MGAGHAETTTRAAGSAAGRHSGSLKWALAMTSTFLVVEVIGGFWTGVKVGYLMQKSLL